ncbi:MAG: 50S ribosomal protein L18 [Thermodesulfobacteriota bacterium]
MDRVERKRLTLKKRRTRVKVRLKGVKRPRLTVYRSNRYIYAQLIDGDTGKTVIAASNLSKDLKGTLSGEKKCSASKKVGELIGKLALEKGINEVVFDRNGFHYHGRVKALADGAREAGLRF